MVLFEIYERFKGHVQVIDVKRNQLLVSKHYCFVTFS